MKTMQMRGLRAATGGAGSPGVNADRRNSETRKGRWQALGSSQLRSGGAARGHRGAAHGHQGMRKAKRMNGKAKGLSDRNTFFICDTDERGSGLEENLRLCSLKFAYVRLMGEK